MVRRIFEGLTSKRLTGLPLVALGKLYTAACLAVDFLTLSSHSALFWGGLTSGIRRFLVANVEPMGRWRVSDLGESDWAIIQRGQLEIKTLPSDHVLQHRKTYALIQTEVEGESPLQHISVLLFVLALELQGQFEIDIKVFYLLVWNRIRIG
jgi:hypothetical protein